MRSSEYDMKRPVFDIARLQNQQSGQYDYWKLAEILLSGTYRLTTTYPFESLEDVQGVTNFGITPPGREAMQLFNNLVTRYHFGKGMQELDAAEDVVALFEHFRGDEDTLSWMVHNTFCELWMAGNDRNLVDLVLSLSLEQKQAVLLWSSTLPSLPALTSAYSGHLDSALKHICAYAEQPRCQAIDPLPVNFMLTDYNKINSENGKPGYSTLVLNASPVNTLPRALLHEIYSRNREAVLPIEDSTWQRIMRFTIPSELAIQQAENFVRYYIGSDTNSVEFRKNIRYQSGGILAFEDLFTTSWNTLYPVSEFSFDVAHYLKVLAPGQSGLHPHDARLMSAAFSRHLAYASLSAYTPVTITKSLENLKVFFEQAFIAPEPSLFHNFMHLQGPFGKAHVDRYIAQYEDEVTGGYLSRFCSVQAHPCELGERLLSYLGSLHATATDLPPEDANGQLHAYAMAKLVVLTLHRGQELGVFDLKQLSLREFLKKSGLNRSDEARFNQDLRHDTRKFTAAVAALPAPLLTTDVLLCCGLGLSPAALENATESQRERSLMLDLGM
ncbi:hypothetical protein ASF02_08960 [Pseudomonas sp. Leaf58]|nr:hypothetical protein ASF02_08960 [Pseudomonas sp. Leaf58]